MTPAVSSPSHSALRTPHRRVQRIGGAATLALCCLALTACGPDVQGSPAAPGVWPRAEQLVWLPVPARGVRLAAGAACGCAGQPAVFYRLGRDAGLGAAAARRNHAAHAHHQPRAQLAHLAHPAVEPGHPQRRAGPLQLRACSTWPRRPCRRTRSLGPRACCRGSGWRCSRMAGWPWASAPSARATRARTSRGVGSPTAATTRPMWRPWTWFKLARTAAGDSDPPVIDAYVPGAAAP